MRWSHLSLLLTIAVAAGLSLFSARFDDYYLNVLLLIGINVILAASLNLVNGDTGQFSLGHAGFMAIGAYVSSMITLHAGKLLGAGAHPALSQCVWLGALLAAALAAALCGLAVGIPSLRLRGDYLAIVTLGFGEIIRVVLQSMDVVGGPRGLSGIAPMTSIFWTFTLAAITVYVVSKMVDSTYGRGFIAVRDDEIAAEAMGINTTKYKVLAFTVGAGFAGIAGALYAHHVCYISPSAFDFMKSIDVVVMVILGGMGNVVGVVTAAVGLTVANEYLRAFEKYRMIVYSLVLIVLMIARPQGLLGGVRWPFRGRLKKGATPTP